MPQPKSFAKGSCQHCGGHIEFPLNGAGQTIRCPHCNWPTILSLRQNQQVEIGGGRAARKRIYVGMAIAAGVALAAGGGAYYYFGFYKQQHTAATQTHSVQLSHAGPAAAAPIPPPKPKPPLDPWHGLMPGKVTLEGEKDSGLVFAVGTLTNTTTRERFGVKVQLELLDEHHHKVGAATDYADVIEPGKEWKFRAMVTDRTAATAKLISVKEQ